jgi:acylphosphatase
MAGDRAGAARQAGDPEDSSQGHARLDASASGRVQGVGFRYFVVDAAQERGLTGWVANLPDGRVRCVAEGRRGQLEALLGALQRGPAEAHVAEVEATWGPATGEFDRFSVRAGGHPGD